MTAQLIRASGVTEEVKPSDGSFFSLEDLQKAVGGFIEIIYTRDGRLMILNEEGKLEDLPYNAEATKLVDLFMGDYITGDVIVCTQDMLE